MKYESPISLTIQKIWPMLKFLQTGQKLYPPDLSIQGHKNAHKVSLKICIIVDAISDFRCCVQKICGFYINVKPPVYSHHIY
jgi:hypothetical protein